MRVLHAPVEIAGQLGLSALGLRELGHVAHTCFPPHRFGYDLPPDLRPRQAGGRLASLARLVDVLGIAQRYDVVHFHFASSFLREGFRYLDALLLRRLGRRVVVEFWGSDVRLPSVEARRNRHYVNSYAEDDAVNRRRMRRWARVTGGEAVVADHSFHAFVGPYFPHVRVVRQRVDTRRLAPAPPDAGARRPLVVHAPSQLAFKGTAHLRRAVAALRERGLAFEYREIAGLSHRDALAVYRDADLIVDQLCAGSHGVFAVEAMALAKPVVCHILPELLPTYPAGFPIVDATPETIEGVLADLLGRPAERRRIGQASREYAERVHDCRVVARRLLDVYRRAA